MSLAVFWFLLVIAAETSQRKKRETNQSNISSLYNDYENDWINTDTLFNDTNYDKISRTLYMDEDKVLGNQHFTVVDMILNEDGNAQPSAERVQKWSHVLKTKASERSELKTWYPDTTTVQLPISERKCSEYRKASADIDMKITSSKQNIPGDRYGIVGGNYTKAGKYPHMGALGWKLDDDGKLMFLCGSTLISSNFIVTAGHCTSKAVRKQHVPPSMVRFGVTNINIKWCRYDVDVRKIIKHPDYKPPSKYYDIALISLDKKMTFNMFIKPACLWRSTNIVSSTASLTGWGTTNPSYANVSYFLQEAEVSIIEDTICKSLVKPSRHFNGLVDHQLCAGNSSGGVDSCKGDSGGPLQIIVNSTYYIVGIVSFGEGCGVPNSPGIYTRVSSFVDWIEKIVWETDNDKK